MDGLPVYNPRELSHMQDVQDVYQAVWRVWQLSYALIVLIGAIQWVATRNRLVLAGNFQSGGLLTVGLVMGIGFLAAVGWQFWFELFHRSFFNPDTWLFNYSDTLIRLFPTQFWFDITMTISAMGFIGGGLLVFLGWGWKLKLTTRKT